MSSQDEPLQQAAAPSLADLPDDGVRAGEDAARRELLELSHTAAGIGTFDWDLVSNTLIWDDRLIELFGLDAGGFDQLIETFNRAVHPDDLPAVTQRIDEAITSCGEFAAEYRIVRPSGEGVWIGARGRVLCDEHGTPVRMLGAAWDITAHREGEARVQRVLESMSTAFFSLHTGWRFTYVNAQAEALLGISREQMLGHVLWELFPAALDSEFETRYRHAMDTAEPVTFDAYYPAPLEAWYEVRARRNPEGLAVYFLDISERHAAQEASELAAARAALLAGVAAELAETPDARNAMATLPRLLVPDLSEWCIATVIDPEASDPRARVRDVGSWHADPDRRALTEDYRHRREESATFRAAAIAAMGLKEPMVLQSAAAATTSRSLDGPALALLDDLAPEATVAVQLRGRGDVLGFLTFCNSAARGPFSEPDLATMLDLAHRVGLALDNARLQASQRDLATELQASLLTALPEPDHLQLAGRYLPAARGAQVGGDWYDAFLVGDGSTTLVIGDVAGHDRGAAVAMAQVRNVLRGVAHALTQPPALVLAALDRAMNDLAVGALTTAVLATVEQSPAEAARGMRTLRWSNAGHPPPLLIRPDGAAELLTRPADLLLGVAVDTERHDHTQPLAPGATVLLYTDGLVERRGEALDTGLERLRLAATRLAGLDLEALCDALLGELATESEDDVALMALRAHPEGVPRPRVAGPRVLPTAVREDRA